MTDFVVNQTSLLSNGDGTSPMPLMSKMGIVPFLSKWDFLALQGRMFNVHNTTIGTVLAGPTQNAASIQLTIPWFRFTVPAGLTVMPHRLHIALATAAGTNNEMAVVYSMTDSYTSGGTAMATIIKNLRSDAVSPRDTAVTNAYIGPTGGVITEAALTSPRVIWTKFKTYAMAASAGEIDVNSDVAWEHFIPIVGPASFLLYITANTTAPDIEFDLTWAEIPTVSV